MQASAVLFMLPHTLASGTKTPSTWEAWGWAQGRPAGKDRAKTWAQQSDSTPITSNQTACLQRKGSAHRWACLNDRSLHFRSLLSKGSLPANSHPFQASPLLSHPVEPSSSRRRGQPQPPCPGSGTACPSLPSFSVCSFACAPSPWSCWPLWQQGHWHARDSKVPGLAELTLGAGETVASTESRQW